MGKTLLYYTCIILVVVFSLALLYSKLIQDDNLINIEKNTLARYHNISKKNDSVNQYEFNLKVLYFEEKYNSVNKRFDDLYVLGSIIIVLLITINVGLFVNTENKVDKYFADNFMTHQNKTEEIAKKAGETYGKLLTIVDNAERISNQKGQTTVLQENEPQIPRK
jgi:hypothetical protein